MLADRANTQLIRVAERTVNKYTAHTGEALNMRRVATGKTIKTASIHITNMSLIDLSNEAQPSVQIKAKI